MAQELMIVATQGIVFDITFIIYGHTRIYSRLGKHKINQRRSHNKMRPRKSSIVESLGRIHRSNVDLRRSFKIRLYHKFSLKFSTTFFDFAYLFQIDATKHNKSLILSKISGKLCLFYRSSMRWIR